MSNDTTTSPAPSTQDALAVLRADHRRIEGLLADYARLAAGHASAADRSGIISRVAAQWLSHAQITQEVFYPALDASEPLLERARANHADIAAQLAHLSRQATLPENARIDAQVAALARAVASHLAFEEAKLFPCAAGLDLAALGTRLALRRGELLGDQGYD
jgi:hypothetical protein